MMDHYYKSVTGWAAFSDLYLEMVRKAKSDSRFIEVGSWLGRSAALMAVEIHNSGKKIEFACVDPWVDGGPDLRDTNHFKNLTAPVYEQFVKNTLPVAQHIRAMKMTSLEASRWFPDESVDFIMLDGDHSYEAVKADIAAWLPKMKPGSVMSGDDYGWPGVTKAVSEAFDSRVVQVVWKKRHADYLKSASYWSVQL